MSKTYSIGKGITAQLMTKREIIDIWLSCCGDNLEKPCCPDCRDTLRRLDNGKYTCDNIMCNNFNEYKEVN